MSANSFLGVFAKSPIKPMIEHISQVHDCAMTLKPFFQAVYAANWDDAEEHRKAIVKKEKAADDMKREIRLNLPSGLFMPVERTDLLELVSQQDRIANKAKDISGLITGRELQIPKDMIEGFDAYLQRCLDATDKAKETIGEFDDLLEVGFKGRERRIVDSLISELDSIEQDTDALQVKLRRQLRALEQEMNPLDAMFLYKILDWVGDLADLAERVGARFELMLARV
ncbi:TIGR00153 family protein [Pseudidiomarina terrestris]|uniref:TIGR00153 family protein n=1 Tax=Pseudidiomarina terrestris TaxID=2820060 RepID=A0AAW7QYJ2_9GAMM|nr:MULTISPECIES: TIGR00153 family protein [unclassified Pseudidiomarina]MDN7125227.1 TIGR00153 family protein [Pseudidiomarina sp. 1APP75-32.1]MDN7127372.1 TIGR00153 family protein [Pseudidiomarina sp. 1APR75-33.1]MDN7129986.1 TIGR00153 family protein [Pseudidiomarina sp. 1APR75-15]MDN7136138.1 TIGR00153 family protein [Pseudidiomarina sp. 1ASP75-5]MDN7138336.1 TIGR00153 family protein [Pseudidiomarina sp. 1ASP75-14]